MYKISELIELVPEDFEFQGSNKPIYSKLRNNFINGLRGEFGNKYDNLIDFLSSTDYFYAPAAAKYHDNYPGGLYYHSMKVYSNLLYYNSIMNNKWDKDSLFIVGFLHDLCKIGLYKMEILGEYNDGLNNIITDYGYSYNNLGYDTKVFHGTKSLETLGKIGLPENIITEELCYSIVYHMGVWTLDAPDYKSALEKYDLVFFTHSADMLASRSSRTITKISLDNNRNVLIN